MVLARLYIGLLLLVSLLVPAVAAAQPPETEAIKVADVRAEIEPKVLAQVALDGQATVWVVLRAKANLSRASSIRDWNARGQFVYDQLTATAETSQQSLRDDLNQKGVAYESFWIMNALRLTAPLAVIEELADKPEVEKILAVQIFEIPDPIPGSTEATIQAVEWGLSSIGAPQVWSDFGVRGEGIVVANIDTGVDFDHPALVGAYRGNLGGGVFDHNYNWSDPSKVCGNPSLAPCDNNNHGTHTMGTMVGDDGAGNQIGVAPGATWIAAKGCESSSCSDGALLEAGQWIVAPTDLTGNNPRPDLRPDIVNNSWGGGGGDVWYQAVVTAWIASGIFPMFSNGNSGPGCTTSGSPGDYLSSYSAGAFDINNAIASFSSRGAAGSEIKPNIAAPGVNIRSSVNGGGYGSFNGTSMASPHVAGTIALMWSAAPALRGDITATRALLDNTAIDTASTQCGGTTDDNNVWGEGRLDAYVAVDQSPRGPTGDLEGVVTDASTSDPILGATVQVSGPTNRTVLSDAAGSYEFNLPIGSYLLTVSKFGYQTQTISVVVTDGATTSQNVALAPSPRHLVSGTVSDPLGNPLEGVQVQIDGTPIAPALTDATGAYSISDVPEGSYTVTAAGGRCTSAQTLPLIVDGDETLDFSLTVRSDSFGYFCMLQTSAYIEAGTVVPFTGDDAATTLTLPFAFPFYGQSYTQAFMGSNGHVGFLATSNAFSNTTIPATGTPNGAIYPFWDDLLIDGSASVRTATLGSTPNRQFVIEWRNVTFFAATSLRIDVEVVLYENGHILIQYRNIATDGREQGNSATIGIENQTGTVALQYAANEAVVNDNLAVLFRANQPPSVQDDSPTVLEDQAATIDVLGNDSEPDGDPFEVDSITQPTNGSASLNADDTVIYTPPTNFNGSDPFTYKATDGALTSAAATVNIDVTPVNDAPSFTAGGNVSVVEDSAAYSGAWASAISAGPANESGQILSFQVTGNTNPGLFSSGPAVAANGTLSFTPAANASGSSSITVVLKDNGGADNSGQNSSAPATFTISVTPVNDAPTLVVKAGGSCATGSTFKGTINLLVGDLESAAAGLTLSGRSSNQQFLANASIVFGGSGANRTMTITTKSRQAGSVTVQITISDGSATRTLNVMVIAGAVGIGGSEGPDIIFGSSGGDAINARGGNDLVCSGDSADLVNGGDGDDTIDGGGGGDPLTGGAGADILRGGQGNDNLIGGTGADAFSGGSGTDAAPDFNAAQGDTKDGTIP